MTKRILPVMALLAMMPTQSLAAAPIHYIFDRDAILRHTPPQPKAQTFRCGGPIPAMVDMSQLFGFYQGSTTMSVVDKGAMGRYMKRVWPTKAMMDQMGAFRDAYVRNDAPREQIAQCALQKMRVWADAGAFLQSLDDNDPMGHRQAMLIILWQLYGMTNIYALVAPDAGSHSDDAAAVLRWFGRLSDVIQAEFTPPSQPREPKLQWLDLSGNHSNWAAVAVGNVGALMQDRTKLAFAVGELHRVLRNVTADGSLPYEIARGGKGLQYQAMAMEAIAALVALADSNSSHLNATEEQQLQRCAQFTIDRTFDPAPLEAATGHKQESKLDSLQWVDMILPHFRRTNPTLAASMDSRIASMRPLKDKFLGGNVSYLFNPSATFADR